MPVREPARRARAVLAAAVAAVSIALAAAPAGAAGFGLYEQGARALGAAGAFTARVDDPTAIFFNPAGLAQVDGHALVLSPNLILFQVDFAGVAPNPGYGVTEETRAKHFPPTAAYYALGIDRKVAAGIGVYSPYGLEIDWRDPDAFTGRYISTFSKIEPFYFSPTVAWAPVPALRLGVGANLVFSRVQLRRHLPAYNPVDDRTEDIGTVAVANRRNFGHGMNAGVQWSPGARWQLGATWRGKVSIDYGGWADFTQLSTGNGLFDALVAADFPPDQRVETRITFPAQGSFGLAWQPCAAWSVEGDLNYTWWSEFDRLDLVFTRTPERNLSIDESWKDAVNVRVGAEYRAGGTSPWAWRAGYYYDESPQPTAGVGPLLPDSNRHGITGGLGWRNGHTAIDGYALYIVAPDRSTAGINRDGFDGTYSPRIFILGASLSLNYR